MGKKSAQILGHLQLFTVWSLERTCELLDQIPKISRVATWDESWESLWKLQPSRLGCTLRLTNLSRRLDRRWSTGRWEP